MFFTLYFLTVLFSFRETVGGLEGRSTDESIDGVCSYFLFFGCNGFHDLGLELLAEFGVVF